VLAAGGIALLFGLRRLQSVSAAPLSQAERDRLKAVLDADTPL
jgi:cytochrome c-type biogenesis protein CcmH